MNLKRGIIVIGCGLLPGKRFGKSKKLQHSVAIVLHREALRDKRHATALFREFPKQEGAALYCLFEPLEGG